LRLIEGFLLKCLPSFDHESLELLEFSVEFVAEIINPVLSFVPILIYLPFVYLLPELILPICNMSLELSNLAHEGLKLNVELNLEAIISNQFKPFLDE
jgi:hypothetical protein